MNKINMKKYWKMNTTPVLSNILWNSARSWVWNVSWWYMSSRKIRRNENVINALKQKVLDTHWHVNSLWHSDAIWQLRSGLTLAQLMVCCLTAPSHYLNQCWLINWLRVMHVRVISRVLNHSISNLNYKFTLLKYFEHLPGTDVLNNLQQLYFVGFTQWQPINLGMSWNLKRKKKRHTDNKHFVWQWDQCYWKQMLLSSRSNIYVLSIINNTNSSFFTPYVIADMIFIVITSVV